MLGHLIVGLLALALIVWLATQRHGPNARELQLACPSCRSSMRPLRDAPEDPEHQPPSYEILACDACERAISAVHALPSAWAYCPACLQRSMQIQCARLPETEGRAPVVQTEETCHICGFEDNRVFGGQEQVAPQQGRVIPFPKARRRR